MEEKWKEKKLVLARTNMELFILFAEKGSVERCYIFPFLDQFGRRFGQMVMAIFFAPQKVFETPFSIHDSGFNPNKPQAQETFDKRTIRNCLLEVGYRHLEPLMGGLEYNSQQLGFHGLPTPSFTIYCPPPHTRIGPSMGLSDKLLRPERFPNRCWLSISATFHFPLAVSTLLRTAINRFIRCHPRVSSNPMLSTVPHLIHHLSVLMFLDGKLRGVAWTATCRAGET